MNIILPEVSKDDYKRFVDGLHDYFTESSIIDRDVGFSGMTEGESILANSLMQQLKENL